MPAQAALKDNVSICNVAHTYTVNKKSSINFMDFFYEFFTGIWKTHFTEDSIWTGSADCAIKRWSLKSFQCLSTFEGHLASVLSLTLVDSKRIASVGSDGLLKVWDIKIGEALGTVDAHEDKIWAVTYSEETQEIITAGRDGNIFFWTDKTEEHKEIGESFLYFQSF